MIKKFLKKPAAGISEHRGMLEKCYQELVDRHKIQYDPAQAEAVKVLQRLMENLLIHAVHQRKQGLKLGRKSKNRRCRNLYIFGDVGHGKSMLMDLFYDNCPIEKKRRVHFHTFMLEVHEFSHNWRKNGAQDVISALAEKIHQQTLLLCFDEFHVIDVANAVILDRLFSRLYELGTVIVSTSNRHPDDLYQGGITPELFLSFIKLLKQASDIIELTGNQDYRLVRSQAPVKTYYTPIEADTTNRLLRRYREMTNGASTAPYLLTVLGRDIPLKSAHGDIAFTSFREICEQPLGPADYLKLASRFKILFLTDIPKLGEEKHDEAKRFSTLIDALYFHNVMLISSAEVPAHELYDKNNSAFFLKRTVSRLIEMQSEHYLNRKL
ncbi:MAG: cell division protein ZapE [Gammaproteobacteria bacterium]